MKKLITIFVAAFMFAFVMPTVTAYELGTVYTTLKNVQNKGNQVWVDLVLGGPRADEVIFFDPLCIDFDETKFSIPTNDNIPQGVLPSNFILGNFDDLDIILGDQVKGGTNNQIRILCVAKNPGEPISAGLICTLKFDVIAGTDIVGARFGLSSRESGFVILKDGTEVCPTQEFHPPPVPPFVTTITSQTTVISETDDPAIVPTNSGGIEKPYETGVTAPVAFFVFAIATGVVLVKTKNTNKI